jgi:hypothetical protein
MPEASIKEAAKIVLAAKKEEFMGTRQVLPKIVVQTFLEHVRKRAMSHDMEPNTMNAKDTAKPPVGKTAWILRP